MMEKHRKRPFSESSAVAMALLATILLAHCSPSGASVSGWAQQVENFTSHAWSQIMAEDGAKPTEAQHTAYDWNWAAVCLGSFLVLCPACGCLCCTYAGILEDDFGAGSWLHDSEPLVCEDSEAGAKQQIQAKVGPFGEPNQSMLLYN